MEVFEQFQRVGGYHQSQIADYPVEGLNVVYGLLSIQLPEVDVLLCTPFLEGELALISPEMVIEVALGKVEHVGCQIRSSVARGVGFLFEGERQ